MKVQRMKKNVKTKRTLNELLVEKCVILDSEGRNGTSGNYRTLKNYIESRYGIVPMTDVTPKWASGLHKMMKDEGKSTSTIKSYFAMLQSITHYAGYIGAASDGDLKLTRTKPYELDKVKLDKPRTRRNKWLTAEDMTRLWDYWVSTRNKSHRKWLGLFFASYLCNGANLADIVRIRYDDEWLHSGGKLLGFTRRKTRNSSGAYIRIPVNGRLRAVMSAIGDGFTQGGLVFGNFLNNVDASEEAEVDKRVMSLNSFCSKVVRKICVSLGMRGDVSYTVARHSYCSVLNAAGCNFALIERSLGHTLPGVTDNYFADTSAEVLFELNSHLFKEIEQVC